MTDIYTSEHLCELCEFKPAECGADFISADDIDSILHYRAIIEDRDKVILCNRYKKQEGEDAEGS